ncbi:MAG: hypothetical protein LC745_07650 [Planctomycetia bacterium]|nr:hypothetical protein [Planctomycetia bacterium]
MPNRTTLTGFWVGHYYQHDRPQPISAELTQDGDRLTGTMSDGVTDRTSSVFEVAAEAGLPPGSDERIVAHLREMLPDDHAAPISYVSHLPPESTLEGTVTGSRVEFLKSYQGKSFGGYKVGERLLVHEVDRHRVHYAGTVSPDGREIEGRWRINPDPALNPLRVEGSFTLRRESGGSDAS